MRFDYSTDPRFKMPKMPVKNKILLFLGLAAGLCLLFVFAFTFFIVALVAGTILYIVSWLQRPGKRPPLNSDAPFPNSRARRYQPPRGRDDDVIDV